jgi:2'-hydroxyisoflavone reductase
MRFLVLGGTAWVGGYLASTALELGHDVTCVARGVSGNVPPGVQFVVADRDGPAGISAVVGQPWDVVLDVARQPAQVRRAVKALAPTSGVYGFVSTGNVYADHRTTGLDETADLLRPLATDVMASMESYGEAKVSCERYALAAFGVDRTMIARAGLIGGPGDPSGRSGYWPLRFARPSNPEGAVLVPGADAPTQLIDVRDLARWLIDACTGGVRGAYNATGETLPLKDHLQVARSVAGHTGPLVEADPDWLVEQKVQTWMGARSLPLWLGPDPEWAGFATRDSSRAHAAGLRHRRLEETLADTLAWELQQDLAAPRGAGLNDADELALLAQYRAVH